MLPPTVTQLRRRRGPTGIPERKARVKQPARNHPPALQDQLAFRAQDRRTGFQHPSRGRQPEPDSPRLSQCAHELSVRRRLWGREVNAPVDSRVLDQPINRSNEVRLVNPRDVLPAISRRSAEAEPDQSEKGRRFRPGPGS